MSWNLEKTKALVEAQLGEAQSKHLSDSLSSIADREFFAGYHFHEHKRLLKEGLDAKYGAEFAMDAILPITETNIQEHVEMSKRVSAHIIALIQSMHALGDTLAFSVAYALGLNIGDSGIQERDISFKRVIDESRKRMGTIPLADKLSEIYTNEEFRYLSALANHCKHRSIIEPKVTFFPQEAPEAVYALKFNGFNFNGAEYPPRLAVEFMEPLYIWLTHKIVECGICLNEILEKKMASQETHPK
jgi:hypothetical protein